MLNVDSFNNILAVVRTCVNAGRPELIEQALIDRLHVGEVQAKIASRPAANTTAAAASAAPATPAAQGASSGPDAVAEAVRKRLAAMYPPRGQ